MATARGLADGAATVAVGAVKTVWAGCFIWSILLLPAIACAWLVWQVDCHQGNEKQRRKVRKSWKVYEQNLVFRFMCMWGAIFFFALIFCGIYESACRGH